MLAYRRDFLAVLLALTATSSTSVVAQQTCGTASTATLSPSNLVPAVSGPVSLPRFDPALGALTGVSIALTGTMGGSFGVENHAVVPQPIATDVRILVEILRADGSTLASVSPHGIQLDDFQPFDGTIDFGGPSGLTYVVGASAAAPILNLAPDSADALACIGNAGAPGVLGLQVRVTNTTSYVYGIFDDVRTQCLLTGVASVQICYTFVPFSTSAYCYGNGTGTACPCGNSGTIGRGCANSFEPAGARLVALGTPSVSADSLVLSAAGVSNSVATYFQGTTRIAGGAGAHFGDGLRCAGGTVIRLGAVLGALNASRYPNSVTDPLVSVKGVIPAPGATRYYQVWYRNAAAYCTTDTFNLSNGLQVNWSP